MIKKIFSISLSIITLVSIMLVLPACAQPAPATTTGPTAQPTTQAAAPAAPITLKVALYCSPSDWQMDAVWKPMAKELEEKSNGRLKLELLPGAVLGPMMEHLTLVENGVADITFIGAAMYPGQFPLEAVSGLSFIYPENSEKASEIHWKLYKSGVLDPELDKRAKILAMMETTPAVVASNKPIRTVADFKGLKIRAAGAAHVPVLKLFGATPTTIAATDQYQSVMTGVIDGTIVPYAAVGAWKLYEVCKYVTELPLTPMGNQTWMNKAKFEKLPGDLQKILEDVSIKWGGAYGMGRGHDNEGIKVRDIVVNLSKQGKIQIINPTPDATKEYTSALKPMFDDFINNNKKAGKDPQKVVDTLKQLLKDAGFTFPY